MLQNGKGGAANVADAVEYYEFAASSGHPGAMVNLGVLLLTGEGGAADPAKAAGWFRKAADQGNPMAKTNLAVLLASGEGVRQNPGQAARLLVEALKAGETGALQSLTSKQVNWPRQLWREVQSILKSERHYRGALDGRPGPATYAAVKAAFRRN